MKWLLSPYTESRTYRAIAYFLLGLGLGVFDLTLLVTGFSLGLGLLITLVGIPILVATLLVARALATMERRLAWSLLDAPLLRQHLARETADGFFWQRLRSLVASRRTWAEVAFLLLRLPMAVLDFAFIIALFALAFGGLALVIVVALGVGAEIGSWNIDTFPESLIFIPLSVVFLLLGARLIVGWAGLSRRFATHFLGRVDLAALKHEVAEILARNEEADAFRILDELEFRLGHGPFLTPIRVQATLLALQSSGHVAVRNDGPRTIYTLT